MVEIKIKFAEDAFRESDYVYVWMKTIPVIEPFYIGQTSKSLADRTGLHIRKSGAEEKSGSTVAAHVCKQGWPKQEYVIRGFEIPNAVIEGIVSENSEELGRASRKKAREAIEFNLYSTLREEYDSIYEMKNATWSSNSAHDFVVGMVENIKNA